ncbi:MULTISPECIES: hypothetical protein [Bombella]|uniref:Uncharacterized protein n=1 Tax=Bombella pollinis TaxID=2967337 RepID=A0ABT3WL97_9PROT|nr:MULTISPECIES: hypothetical protein [Bombella]MCT6856196.1 hypothetical protein [Bombella apis]MCX5619895.1 hypothetical protein [Bombella pollinis]MUG04605.1 hypothetical protein [Bombella sp. ESL0378]MUG90099.1 hypothetical protein [Bombella sp. ESL0385]
MKISRTKGAIFGLLGLAGVTMAPAHAERVLTEHEAGKLTFDALIAPPSAFQHVARHSWRGHVLGSRVAATHRHHAVAVRNVSYYSHTAARHGRVTHRHRG